MYTSIIYYLLTIEIMIPLALQVSKPSQLWFLLDAKVFYLLLLNKYIYYEYMYSSVKLLPQSRNNQNNVTAVHID